ncbi:hypothetical protein K1T71_011106 [Dendrolimus kikuchii]|uniref:Uncharacterized protein n=1 Tax=Dendrolimus kikuchii TaxID=765133 RepID=A0ACC1CN44_9NEOP|nr:hypothetical protein K1T71_011106 [Dendrolimus kikuchii]
MNIRQRKLKDNNTAAPNINIRTRTIKQPRRLKKIFIFLVVCVLFITYFLGVFAGQSQWLDGLAKYLGYESVYHHAVIIDAGSTGSRVLAYKFRVPFTVFGQANLDLVDEFWGQSKPGLSSYADDPAKGADTIVQLIRKAEYLTPVEKRSSTPLIVRATAGLRLLPTEKAKQLIAHVADAISKLGYDVTANSVDIMDGSDEGIFIWYTVNLLHNLMDGGETMAALDLGGGSTQITYHLTEAEAAKFPPADQYVVAAGATNITLYTHSYLNLGLMAARYGVFLLGAGENVTNEFTSVCVEPIIQKEPWTYANKQYYVSGAHRRNGMKAKAAFEQCHGVVKRYVSATMDWEPQQAPKGSVAAMSYFYDVATDAGMINVMKGGRATVADYRAAAVKACSANNVEQPWACIDLVYVVTLLQDGYKIADNEPISLFNKINGHEVSWALGLAYTTVMNKMAAAP